MKRAILCFLAFAILNASSFAEADGKEPAGSDDQQIRAILSDIERGWENGDPEPFRRHFLDFTGARYFESGGENTGLSDLVDHHVVPEKTSIPDLQLDFSNTQIVYEGAFAWVVSDTSVKGTIAATGAKIEMTGKDTTLFRKTNSGWKVVHTHSSSRAKKT